MKTEQQLLLTHKYNLCWKEKKLFVCFSGFIAAVKKHWGIPLNFLQFYEMRTNDIIMVTGSNAHMQIKIQRYVQMWIVHL